MGTLLGGGETEKPLGLLSLLLLRSSVSCEMVTCAGAGGHWPAPRTELVLGGGGISRVRELQGCAA
jgi:hypothetical protein